MTAIPARFSAADIGAMRRALALAERGLASTDPNPRVGCVITQGAEVVGEGWHERAGEPHAEVHALRAAGARAAGGTVYVTLEPCAHFGRTPPCADALIAARVARVVFAVRDPNPRVDGAGAARLAAAGIEVDSGLLEADAEALNPGFLQRLRHGRPWVRLKQAMTLDGRVALASGVSRWISGVAARDDVQQWRARSSCVLSGIGTVLADDPALTVRIGAEPRRQPLRVVLDSRLRTPPAAQLLGAPGTTLILTTSDDAAAIRRLEARGARVERIAGASGDAGGAAHARRPDLGAVLSRLAALEVNELWIEAGPQLAGAWLACGLVDEWILYVAPLVLGADARPLLAMPQPPALEAAPRFNFHDVRRFGDDLRLILRPQGTVGA